MLSVVLDTNVVLDCWVFDDPDARRLKDALQSGRLVAVRSAATDAELEDVLGRAQFGLAPAARSTLLDEWRDRAALAAVDSPAAIRCADPADQKFLDLALAARVHALFTKDKALLATAARARAHGLRIVLPKTAESMLLFEDDLP